MRTCVYSALEPVPGRFPLVICARVTETPYFGHYSAVPPLVFRTPFARWYTDFLLVDISWV